MRTRNNQILLRLSDDEFAQFRSRVQKTGLSQEAYLRILISGRIPKEKPGEAFYAIMRELSAIGNNVHQLAAKANALGFIDAPQLARQAEEWSRFRLDVRRRFLDAEKAGELPLP